MEKIQKRVSRILSTGAGGGCLVPGEGSGPGGCLVGGARWRSTPGTATAAGGTHPTAMHSS